MIALRYLSKPRPVPNDEVLLWGADAIGGAPFVWEEGGKLKGFEAEVMEELGARLHLQPKFVQVQWNMLPQALHIGHIQLIFNGYGWSPQKGQVMSATLPYAVARMRLIVRKGDPVRSWSDLRKLGANRKRRVGTLPASESERYLLDNFRDYVDVDAPSDGTVGVLLALNRGQLDASVQDEFTAGHYINNRDFPKLEMVGKPVPMGTPIVAYTAQDNAELRDRINDKLRQMFHDGTLKRIYTSYGVWNDEEEKLPTLWSKWPPPDKPARGSLRDYAWLLLKGARMTVLLACLTMPLAMLLGMFIALGRVYGRRWLAAPLNVYVEVLRGTPLLLQLLVIYYLLPDAGISLPAFWAAVMALAINYSAYESEHYRAGLLAVPRGQMEAALTLGLTRWAALRRIVLPQALRTVVPSVTNDFIALFKDTAICSVIAVVELTGQYQRLLVGQPRMIVTFALLTALLYLMMSYPLALLARRLERRPQTVDA
jgi:polar amino acid transport system substrate-binding protein